MRTTLMTWTACALFLLSSACDLTVDDGDVVVLSNDGLVLGSFPKPGDFQASPAARLLPGGTLVIENASLLGGNVRLGSLEQGVSSPASAIEATGGTLRIQSGLIRAGELAFTRNLGLFVPGAPGIDAVRTRLEMSGGTIAGGPAAEFLPNESGAFATGGVGLVAEQSEVRIDDGAIRPGRSTSGVEDFFGPPFAVILQESTFDIRGGDFRGGPVRLVGGSGRISGGRFDAVQSVGAIASSRSSGECLEVRGGSIPSFSAFGNAAFLFGTGFSQPLGVLSGGRDGQTLRLTGTLEDGTPLDLELELQFESSVILAQPGTRGCL